ncbi:MAG: DUF480 domain-containing protein [Actinobacteria bacterium]|nr:DUF480 domain-containing protein [Actinomycetota bacterium]
MDATAAEIRVLGGCLIEKQRTTPDVYPLSLNSLRLACNQATNRDPVVDYDEPTVRAALDRLARKGWTRLASGPGGRVAKYRQLLDEALDLLPSQSALLAVLMLRGPQTPGELKSRSERLYPLGSLEDVHRTLETLIERELVARLPRRPGQKEERYAQLLGGEQDEPAERPRFDAAAAVRSLHAPEDGTLDRGTLFELLADDVHWQVAGVSSELPWAGTFHGPEAVREWLEKLNEHMAYERFELQELFADGDTVVEVVEASGKARATQRPFGSEVVRIWTFRGDKAVRVRSYYDTAAYARAFSI